MGRADHIVIMAGAHVVRRRCGVEAVDERLLGLFERHTALEAEVLREAGVDVQHVVERVVRKVAFGDQRAQEFERLFRRRVMPGDHIVIGADLLHDADDRLVERHQIDAHSGTVGPRLERSQGILDPEAR